MPRLILAACLAATTAAAAAATMDDGARRFEAKQWAEAAAAYESVLAQEPGNALARIRLARARAANGEADAALAALTAWFESGNGAYQVAMRLPEFEALRADPRFVALLERFKPCNTPEYRQFDFWVGDWNVESAASPGTVSHNRISLINDGCTLREEYDTPQGYVGTSLNFYDSRLKRWHQTWIDNQGGGLALDGGLQGRDMVLESAPDGLQIQRITWTPLPDGRVRQHWQSTADGGKTWTTAFDGTYSRR
jgi:tetratricopeptide (TPR) repeat protein